MISAELSRTALELPLEDRLELARRLVESVVAPAPLSDALAEGIRRIEQIASGQIAGLSDDHYPADSEQYADVLPGREVEQEVLDIIDGKEST